MNQKLWAIQDTNGPPRTAPGGAAQSLSRRAKAIDLSCPSPTPARENRACRVPRLRGWKPGLPFTQG